MIKEESVWATDVRYLNDSQEFQYALDLAVSVISQLKPQLLPSDTPLVQEFERAIETAPRVRMYAASFSEDPDLLSQWRAYCPPSGGFAIGFRPQILMEAAECLLIPCVYDDTRQSTLVHELIGVLLNDFRAAPQEEEPERWKRLVGLNLEFLSGLIMLATVLKHPSFKEEREWRLVLRGRVEPEPRVSYREGRSGIVPYMPLRIRRNDGSLRIDEIVVGPNPHIELAKQAVISFLRASGVTHDGVRTSIVPYRTW